MEPRRNSAASAQHVPSLGHGGGSGAGSILNTILVVLLIITSIVASAYLAIRIASSTSNGGAVKGKQYQALFLTNGQVYFGHLGGINNGYVKLTDIYYLQVQQAVQPADAKKDSAANPNVSLAKLGSELHGPEDVMYVSREQVLFWENLKEDGKVAQAIKDYKTNGNNK